MGVQEAPSDPIPAGLAIFMVNTTSSTDQQSLAEASIFHGKKWASIWVEPCYKVANKILYDFNLHF